MLAVQNAQCPSFILPTLVLKSNPRQSSVHPQDSSLVWVPQVFKSAPVKGDPP